jgi:organic hydroperoxide reductase OsmC/OhrA
VSVTPVLTVSASTSPSRCSIGPPCVCAAVRGGDPEKADPEELLVAALSACHMLWFLDFARRERLRVLSYEDEPVGTMDSERFVSVVLRPRVEFEGQVPPNVLERLHHRSHQACFIANSVTCKVRVERVRLCET